MATMDPNTPAVPDEKRPNADKDVKLKKLEESLLIEAAMEQEKLVRNAQKNFQLAADSRRRFDWEWLARDLFRRGYQFTRYNPQTKTVTMATTNNTRIPINLVAASMRVIRNQVTAFRPKWEVMPTNQDDESRDNARYSGKTLDYVYIKSHLKKRIKETVMQGLLFSVGGAWQINWNKDIVNEDDTKGFIDIWLIDPFDFYIDPNCTDGMSFSDAQFLIKAVRRSVSDIKNDKEYSNTDMILKGDPRVAASEYKQFLLQSIKFIGRYTPTTESETVILKEGWFKEYDEKTKKCKMRVLTWVDGVMKPLKNQLIDTEDFPFRMYQADINPLEVYGEGWARHTIPINRVINALESSIFDYNYRYAKGRIVIDKNSGVRVVTNEHGSIIEKNRGADVHSLPLQPLPANAENQVQRMRGYFEDLSGAHDVSLGRIPTGVKSGIGIAELKQADATNQDDLVDNLEDFLVEVAKKILMILSEEITFPRLVKATNIAGKADYFAVLGEESQKKRKNKKTVKMGAKEYPLAVIAMNNTIQVQIGSWLAYGKQQRQQELKDLYSTGVIDQRTLLEHLEFGDIDTIIDRTRQEAILKKRRDMEQLGPGDQVTQEEIAQQENSMLAEGNQNVAALPSDDHKIHLIIHGQSPENDLIGMHMQEHQALMKAAAEQPPPGAEVPGAGQPQLSPEELQLAQAGMATMQQPPGGGIVPPPPAEEVPPQGGQGGQMPPIPMM